MGTACSRRAKTESDAEEQLQGDDAVTLAETSRRCDSTRGRRLSVLDIPPSFRATKRDGRRSQQSTASVSITLGDPPLSPISEKGSQNDCVQSISQTCGNATHERNDTETINASTSLIAEFVSGENNPQSLPSTGRHTKIPYEIEIGSSSKAGREYGSTKTNQDNYFAFGKFMRHGISLYAVFDGHGPSGHVVSSLTKHQLPLMLTRHLNRRGIREISDAAVKSTLHTVFLEIHDNLSQPSVDAEFSGTTATLGLLLGTKLYVAWVGDSRCVLGIRNADGLLLAQDVTHDHKPDKETERSRIVSSGGRVQRLHDFDGTEIGPSRVWSKTMWVPGLAMSRSLGDCYAHTVGVSSEPDVSIVDITSAVEFVVMASDGVWEFISSQEAVDIITSAADASMACLNLIEEAYQRWQKNEQGTVDDITAVVVRFKHHRTETCHQCSTEASLLTSSCATGRL